MKSSLIVALVAALVLTSSAVGVAVSETPKSLTALRDPEILWDKCVDVPVLGDTCIGVYVVPENLTLGVQLNISGHIYNEDLVEGNQICLDDDTLIDLITDIPALLPYKKLIEELKKLKHFIPADVLSVCVTIENIKYDTPYIDGCPVLNAKLICWDDKCLYKGDHDFGCFHVKV